MWGLLGFRIKIYPFGVAFIIFMLLLEKCFLTAPHPAHPPGVPAPPPGVPAPPPGVSMCDYALINLFIV